MKTRRLLSRSERSLEQLELLSRASIHEVHEAMVMLARQLDHLVARDPGLRTRGTLWGEPVHGLEAWEFSEVTRRRSEPPRAVLPNRDRRRLATPAAGCFTTLRHSDGRSLKMASATY